MVKQLKISCPYWPQLGDQRLEDMWVFSDLVWLLHVNPAFSDALLSLGLKVLAQKFPEGLITGSLPASCQQALPPGSARKRSSPKVPPPPAENKWRFTPEDLKKIEYYLEEDQGPSDNPSKILQPLLSIDLRFTVSPHLVMCGLHLYSQILNIFEAMGVMK